MSDQAEKSRSRNVETTRERESRAGVSPVPWRPTASPSLHGRPLRSLVKVLFFSANALDKRPLAVDDEYQAIADALAASPRRAAFSLIIRFAAKPGDLQSALLEHQPDILHFACHGTTEAELMLVAEHGGGGAPLPAAALATVLQILGERLRLVVCNACWSDSLSDQVAQAAGLCIGMQRTITDKAAIALSTAFYRALGHEHSVREAFELARAALASEAASEQDVPRLVEAISAQAEVVRLAPVPLLRRHGCALAFLVGGIVLALGVTTWASGALDRHPEFPAPPSDMVRHRGGMLRLGWLESSRQPAECSRAPTLASAKEGCRPSPNGPPLAIEVAAFDLDRDEVTNREYAAWLAATSDAWTISPYGRVEARGSTPVPLVRVVPECGGGLMIADGQVRAGADKGRWPVACVTWHGAVEYCRAQGKRLPSEREWEIAAKGAQGRPFPWGEELPGLDLVSFERGDSAAKVPNEVGTSSQDRTPEGARDLGGNVAEWVEDGRGDVAEKTIRGGTWASAGPCHLLTVRCARRRTDGNYGDVGFRCARSMPGRDAGERRHR